MPRQLHCLIFELECEPPWSQAIIVWTDENGNGRFTHPAHPDHTILDVRAGEVIVHRRRTFRVKSVRPYRACPIEAEYPEIARGRDWLQP